MDEKRRFKVTVDGKPYTILATRSDAHMNAVVELINSQLGQLKSLDPTLSREDRSILMALNALSDQLLKESRIIELEKELEAVKLELSKQPKTNGVPYKKKNKERQ